MLRISNHSMCTYARDDIPGDGKRSVVGEHLEKLTGKDDTVKKKKKEKKRKEGCNTRVDKKLRGCPS